jgi:hypothetical protein
MREISMLSRGTMGSKSLTTAGIVAMASAILTLPLFLISIKLAERHDEIARTGQIALQWTGTIIFLILILLFRRFLVFNCLFKKANSLITVLIILNLVYAAVTSFADYIPQGEERIAPFAIGLIVLLGFVQAGLGVRLLKLEDDLGGMKRTYCWLNILTGVFLASILLIPLGIIASAVTDVMLGTIFFIEAKRLAPPP